MRRNKAVMYLLVAVMALLVAGSANAQDKPANVAGKWQMSTEGPQGAITSTLMFEQDGDKLKGTLTNQRGESPLTGTVKGNKITFTVKRETPRGEFTIEYAGTVDGETIKGTIQGPAGGPGGGAGGGPRGGGGGGGQGPREWTAKREKAK